MRITTSGPVTVAPLLAALVLLSPIGGSHVAQAQAPAGGVVKVDFRALGADGQPITDLKPSEVTLKVAGKAREVRSLDLVAVGVGATGAAAPTPANPPYATNAQAANAPRTLLLVIDDESVNPGREQSLVGLLGRLAAGTGANDRVGLLSVRRGGVNLPPSTNRLGLQAAVDALKGQSSSETPEAFKCRTQVTLQALDSILASAPADSPTTVVFMSASLSQPSEAMARMRSPSDLENRSDLCRLTAEDFERVGAAAAGSRAQLYVVQLMDGTTMSPSEAGPGIENIAGVTGTQTLRLTASGDTVSERILREMAGSYALSFAPDGKLTAQWTARNEDFGRSPVTAALTAAPGTYRMRVAAVDSTGRGGTADYTLDAELAQAGPLQLSTLVVGSPKAGSFAPQLHFGSQDPAGAGYLEIYGVPKGGAVTVTLEIAPSEDAPAIGNVPAQVVPGDSEDMRRAVGGFSIENLAPGDHVMRAIVSVDGKPVGRVVRTLRKGQ